MALTASALIRISNAGANAIFQYSSNDTVAVIVASGYFNSVTEQLKQGDVILISGDLDGIPDAAIAIVSSATGAATVTTAT